MSGSDLRTDDPAPAKRAGLGKGLTLAVLGVVVLGAAAALYVIGGASSKPGQAPTVAAYAKGTLAKLQESPSLPPPTTAFVDAEGKTVRIADFKGEVLVVNLWATWCAPCKKEMPTLAALQKAYGGRPVKVIAISIDKPEQTAEAKAFIASHAPLAFYQDSTLNLPFALAPPAQGFPTTLIYDKSGVERARIAGEADWSTPEAKAVVDHLLAS